MVALVYERHIHHGPVMAWFETLQEERSAFVCRVSQMGLLRLLTQQAAMGGAALTQREAWATYTGIREDFRASFAQEPLGLSAAFKRISMRDEVSPKLWTDDYLAAFASQSGLMLVTCDRKLARRSPGTLLLTP